MVAMVCHGRAPDDGTANGSMSASINFVTSSLKSTNIDADMHVHAPMQSVGFPTYQDGEATPIWAFPMAEMIPTSVQDIYISAPDARGIY